MSGLHSKGVKAIHFIDSSGNPVVVRSSVRTTLTWIKTVSDLTVEIWIEEQVNGDLVRSYNPKRIDIIEWY